MGPLLGNKKVIVQESLIAKTVHGAPYVTGSVTVALGLSQEEWMVTGVIVGIFCTLVTTAANIVYKMHLIRTAKASFRQSAPINKS